MIGSPLLPLVFFVDDEQDIQEMWKALFAGEFEVRTASNVEDAIALARTQERSATIFMDINLGSAIKGPELLLRMRANSKYPLASYYLSGDSRSKSHTEALLVSEGWVTVYLLKPVDPELIRTLVTTAAPAHFRLIEQATKDPLTGLYNRNGFAEVASKEITHAIQENTSIACIFVDVDNFKTINDTFGYQVGDSVIHAIANCIKEQGHARRITDTVCRWGGDEFVVILSVTKLNKAWNAAQSIEEAVGRIRIHEIPREKHPTISVSTGVSGMQAQVMQINLRWSTSQKILEGLISRSSLLMQGNKSKK